MSGKRYDKLLINLKNMDKKYGAFSSSEDYNKLADTVRGVIVSLSSIIIFVGALKGFPVSNDQIIQFAQQAGTTIGAFGTAVGSIWTMYGLIKKIIVKLTKTQ